MNISLHPKQLLLNPDWIMVNPINPMDGVIHLLHKRAEESGVGMVFKTNYGFTVTCSLLLN